MFFLRHCDRNSVQAVLFSIGEVYRSARAPFWTMISSIAGPRAPRLLGQILAPLTRHASV
jgi:hypothetical protein